MKRSMCGIALLAAATALWSCNGDPTDSIRDEPPKVLADPTDLVLNGGEAKFVTVELVDGQGNQLDAQFTPQNVSGEVTVVEDQTFLQTSAGRIKTASRFVVTGVSAGTTSFALVSDQGPSVTISARVITPIAGTTDPATAPTIALAPVGQTVTIFDAPDFATSIDAFYKITVPPDAGGVTATLDWNSDADMDLFPCDAATISVCDFTAATGSKPESASYVLAPGDYFFIAELFEGTAPSHISLAITTDPPAAP